MRPRGVQVRSVRWRCCLCPADGHGWDVADAWARFDEHYLKVHYERPKP